MLVTENEIKGTWWSYFKKFSFLTTTIVRYRWSLKRIPGLTKITTTILETDKLKVKKRKGKWDSGKI